MNTVWITHTHTDHEPIQFNNEVVTIDDWCPVGALR